MKCQGKAPRILGGTGWNSINVVDFVMLMFVMVFPFKDVSKCRRNPCRWDFGCKPVSFDLHYTFGAQNVVVLSKNACDSEVTSVFTWFPLMGSADRTTDTRWPHTRRSHTVSRPEEGGTWRRMGAKVQSGRQKTKESIKQILDLTDFSLSSF